VLKLFTIRLCSGFGGKKRPSLAPKPEAICMEQDFRVGFGQKNEVTAT
jgi:hypothetical protein